MRRGNKMRKGNGSLPQIKKPLKENNFEYRIYEYC